MTNWSNRLIILVSSIGIAISGLLSFAAAKNLVPPCGKALNCQIVLTSEMSKIGGVSVAYIGLFGYIVLFSMAVARSMTIGKTFVRLSLIGLAASALGFLFSSYLTYYSISEKSVLCVWCISSLVTIFILTVLHGALLQGDEVAKEDFKPSLAFGGFGLVAAVIAIVIMAGQLKEKFSISEELRNRMPNVTIADVMPDASKVSGNPDAKVTLIEFADFNCGSCRAHYATTNALLQKYGGRVRLAYRHFFPIEPKPGHETSRHAAMIAEIAAKEGKFWKYVDTVMAKKNTERIKTLDGLIAVAAEAGLSRPELLRILNPRDDAALAENDAILVRVAADIDKATELMIVNTPTYLLAVEGMGVKPISSIEIEAELEAPEVKRLISGP